MKDETGKEYGRLFVRGLNHINASRVAFWLCRCQCGQERVVRGCNLRNGQSQSCGCLQKEIVSAVTKTRRMEKNSGWKGGANNRGSLAWANRRMKSIKESAIRNECAMPSFSALELAKFGELHGGRCDICGVPETECTRALAVDHCHETGAFRGFLCNNCNAGLGRFRDDPSILQKAINYLLVNAGIIEGAA